MKKNYFYNLSLSITNILFPLLSFPYASRILGPQGIGKVQLASSFAQYFALFAALGIPIYGIQEIAKVRHNQNKLNSVFSELLVIYFTTSILFTLVYFGVIFGFPFFRPNIEIYCYAGLIILFGFASIDWLYSGLEDFKSLALRTILIKLLSLVFLYFFVNDVTDFRNYLFVTIFSLTGNNLINFLMLKGKASFVFPAKRLLAHIKPLFYIFSTTIAASMYTILDTVLLGFLSTEKAVGLYTAAIKLSKVSMPFVTSIGVILIPRISAHMAEKAEATVQQLLDRSFHFIVFFSIPIAAGLLILAPEFIIVFSGREFLEAANSMRIVSFLPLLIGFGHFFAFQILVPGNRYRQMFVSVVGGVFFCLALSFILVPRYHESGTAIANIVTELVVTVSYFYFVRKYFRYTYQWHFLWKAALCCLVFLPVIEGVRWFQFEPFFTLILSMALCALTYFVMQYLVFKDQFVLTAFEYVRTKLSFRKTPD